MAVDGSLLGTGHQPYSPAPGTSGTDTAADRTRTARVPKYYRLKRHLQEMTETMPPGTPVPPERSLAAEFDTSRTTVRQALQELVVEGRLERIQGKGTFVAKPKVSQALQLTSYTEDMRAQGLEPTSQLLEIGYITADDRLGELLDIPEGRQAMAVEVTSSPGGAGFVQPGDHVSVIASPSGNDAAVARYLDQDVQVLAVGLKRHQEAQASGATSTGDGERMVLTLALTSSEAEQVAFAVLHGNVYFTLVTPGDGAHQTPGRPGRPRV
jgi:DNA-binding GntR family transcriptional regulator